MALTLIVETGEGLANSNTYASRATCDAFAESRLYSTAWTSATDANKDAALVQATRTIDQEIQFAGYRANELQALQWPRAECPDPDAPPVGGYGGMVHPRFSSGQFVDSTIVPRAIVDACCELAIQMLAGDRTGDSQAEGVKRIDLAGAIEIEFKSGESAPLLIPRDVLNTLAKYGSAIGASSGIMKLTRA